MTEDHGERRLRSLARTEVPAPDATARRRALQAAALAFESAEKKSEKAPQGKNLLARLMSIVPNRGNWTMDMRIPLGTAALALLLLPLGYQLYSTTALTQPWTRTVTGPVTVPETIVRDPEVTVSTDAEVATTEVATPADSDNAPVLEDLTQAAPTGPSTTAVQRQRAAGEQGFASKSIAISEQPEANPLLRPEPEEQTLGGVAANEGRGLAANDTPTLAPEMREELAFETAPMTAAGATSVESDAMSMPAPMQHGTTPLETRDEFTSFEENPVKVAAEEPVSTFSVDVDTASYAFVRNMLEDGYLPDPDAVRIEEMINYFPYDYALPETADTPFRPSMAIYPTPWNPATQILHIGIKGYVPPAEAKKPSNLVFLIDTSGSMDEPDRLPLLKRAFGLLVDQLGATDTVSIVVYAGSAGTVLEPTPASEKATILAALDNLSAGGSTAGAEGIELAYRLAEQNKIANGINRVILATDGDFNVGISDPEQLIDFVRQKRETGVFLSVLGFGMGNYQDDTMQALAQNGNGNAAYIDSFREAQKVLVEEMGGTLETIAKDVKIQIEFNPAFVSEYRLIGYETRALNREDFNNDKVDAGEIGAGHTVTALYEITPVGSGAELVDPLRFGTGTAPAPGSASTEIAYLKLRYKLPEGEVSTLTETPVGQDLIATSIAAVPEDMRFAAAVAAFAQKLKGSNYAGALTYEEIRQLALGARGLDENGYRSEFIQMIKAAEQLN